MGRWGRPGRKKPPAGRARGAAPGTARQAQRAAQQDPSFAANVEALTAAQPKDLDASEIEVRLGATWIDKEYIQQFMYETFDTPFIMHWMMTM